MEKRVLEKMMFGTFLFFVIFTIAGWYMHIPMLFGSGITLFVISMICWLELDAIDTRHKKLERKYK
jgi:hypothetical protein